MYFLGRNILLSNNDMRRKIQHSGGYSGCYHLGTVINFPKLKTKSGGKFDKNGLVG